MSRIFIVARVVAIYLMYFLKNVLILSDKSAQIRICVLGSSTVKIHAHVAAEMVTKQVTMTCLQLPPIVLERVESVLRLIISYMDMFILFQT